MRDLEARKISELAPVSCTDGEVAIFIIVGLI